MSGCEPNETSQLCEHGRPVKFGCSKCYSESNEESEYSLVIQSMKQTIEMWQKGCEVLISDLQGRIKDIEYRLEHIIALPSELDIRLQDVERQLDKSQDYDVEFQKRLDKLDSDRLGQELDPKVWKLVTERIDELESQLNIVRALGSRAYHPKKPHKCPVCDGH